MDAASGVKAIATDASTSAARRSPTSRPGCSTCSSPSTRRALSLRGEVRQLGTEGRQDRLPLLRPQAARLRQEFRSSSARHALRRPRHGARSRLPRSRAAHAHGAGRRPLQDLRMTRRTRTFADVSDADVMSQIANDHSLSPSVAVTGPTYKVLAQVNQSDLAFLRERARSIDAEVWVDGTTLNAKSRTSRGGTPKELKHGQRAARLQRLADLAMQRTSVAVNGWDVAGKQAIEARGDRRGHQRRAGRRRERRRRFFRRSSARARRRWRTPSRSTVSEAQAEAEAFFKRARAALRRRPRRRARRTPQLRVGQHVKLQRARAAVRAASTT